MLVALLVASSSILGYYGYYRYKKKRRSKSKQIGRYGAGKSRVRIFGSLKYPPSRTPTSSSSSDTVGSSSSLRASFFRGWGRGGITRRQAVAQASDIESNAIVKPNSKHSKIKVIDSATDLQKLEQCAKPTLSQLACSKTLSGVYNWTYGWSKLSIFKYCAPRKWQRLPRPETIDETSVLTSGDNSSVDLESGSGQLQKIQGHQKSDSFYSLEQATEFQQNGAHSRNDSAASFEVPELGSDKLLDGCQDSSVGSCGSSFGQEISEERIQFLQVYDTAFLNALNFIYGCNAKDMTELPDLPVAPWNKNKSGYKGFLDEEQEKCLQQIKERFPEHSRFHSDHDILKFLRSCNFDMEVMSEKYQKYIEEYRGVYLQSPSPLVREVHGVQFESLSTALSYFPARYQQLTDYWQNIFKYFLHNIVHECDKQGRPVVYVRMTEQWNRKYQEHIDMEDKLLMLSSSIELQKILCHMASKKMGYVVEEVVQIMDLAGLPPRGLLGCVAGGDQLREMNFNFDFNPDALSKIYIVNVPGGPMTRMVWNTASMAMPKRMRSRISLLGRGYIKTFNQDIGQDKVPTCYGGNASFEWAPKPPMQEWEKYIEELEIVQGDEKV